MIAALYVAPKGCYYGLPEVDPWPASRDARLYAGPWPVVAHPPCERWGRYATGGPYWLARHPPKVRGDDGGCFAAALASVRRWGGVLEHPADSRAFAAHGLAAPLREGGWTSAGDWLGWSCCVEQGHYGHRAPKPTWLYAARIPSLPSLIWGPSAATAYLAGVSRQRRQERGIVGRVEALSMRQRSATPLPFRDLLLSIARSCTP